MSKGYKLIQYSDLSDFQKWFFFYAVKNQDIPSSLDGVIPKMCLTVKMKIDVDKFDAEKENLQREVAQLVQNGLFEYYEKISFNDRVGLTDKGGLYIVQKILKPLYDAKDKNELKKITSYFKTEDEQILLNQLYDMVEPREQVRTLSRISDKVLAYAMPVIEIFNQLNAMSNIKTP